MKRLPDSTRASDLILAGKDAQAMHALMNLQRRLLEAAARQWDDESVPHQQSHTLDGVKRDKGWRLWHAKRARTLEAVVELLEGM